MRHMLFCLLLFFAASAHAQQQAAPAPAPAPPVAAKLSPAEAQAVLDVLNDPQKRAAFTATLQALVKATKAAAPAPVLAAVPLAPDSVGAQVIAQSASWFADLTGQISAFNHVLGNLPSVWAFTRHSLTDADARAGIVDAAWHLVLVIAIAALVQWAFERVLRGPVGLLARLAPSGDVAEPPPEAAENGAARRRHRFASTLLALRRLPFMLARLLLDLVPVATFLLLAWLGLNFLRPDSRNVLWVAITAYAGARITVAVTRALASPDHPSLRVLQLSGDGPAYTVRWMRWLVAVAAFGYAASVIGEQFGMPDPAREAFIKAVALIDHLLLVLIVLQCRRPVAAAIRRAGGETRWRAAMAARVASLWHVIAIFFIVGLWLVWAAQVRHGYERMWRLFLVTAGILLAIRVLGVVVLGGLDRGFHLAREPGGVAGPQGRAGFYYQLLRRILAALLWVVAALALLQAWGVQLWSWFHRNTLGGQLVSAAATILVAGLICLLVWEATNAALDRNLGRLRQAEHLARAARLHTLMPILRSILLSVLAAVFVLTVLSEIGVNVAPLLAGAGILGVAIGFGSQKLVQDFITGIFLLLENTMQVGDTVTLAGLSGTVENLSIRTMRLRAGDGSVHTIPFSSVSTVTNANRGIGNVPVSVTVPPETDIDHVSDVLAGIAREMRGERRFADMMRSDFQLWGVDRVESAAVTVTGQIVCSDSGRWPVQREFNRRMVKRFVDEGIRVTSPAQTVRTIALTAAPVPEAPAPETTAPEAGA
jgi:small-conductance mechanosensitive channel